MQTSSADHAFIKRVKITNFKKSYFFPDERVLQWPECRAESNSAPLLLKFV